MNKVYAIKSGDILPPIPMQALDKDGNPLDLTGFTAQVVIAPCPGARKIASGEATILDPVAGTLQYEWKEGETDRPGEYLLELVLVNGSGGQQTIPGAGYATVIITPRL